LVLHSTLANHFVPVWDDWQTGIRIQMVVFSDPDQSGAVWVGKSHQIRTINYIFRLQVYLRRRVLLFIWLMTPITK